MLVNQFGGTGTRPGRRWKFSLSSNVVDGPPHLGVRLGLFGINEMRAEVDTTMIAGLGRRDDLFWWSLDLLQGGIMMSLFMPRDCPLKRWTEVPFVFILCFALPRWFVLRVLGRSRKSGRRRGVACFVDVKWKWNRCLSNDGMSLGPDVIGGTVEYRDRGQTSLALSLKWMYLST